MFEKIEDVPAPIAEFYHLETRQEQQFKENGEAEYKEVPYEYQDEAGAAQVAMRMESVYLPRNYVVQVPVPEFTTFDDVWRVAKLHAGKRDDLIKRFLKMVCDTAQWQFHLEYLKWYKESLELAAVILPNIDDLEAGVPDPLIELQNQIAAHEADCPPKPALLDIPQWFRNNAEDLRRCAYASTERQAEMYLKDMVQGTTTLVDHFNEVNSQYPTA